MPRPLACSSVPSLACAYAKGNGALDSSQFNDGLSALASVLRPEDTADPYPGYRKLQQEHPIWRPLERLFVISKFDDCAATLRDAKFGHAEVEDLITIRGTDRSAQPFIPEEIPVRSFLGLNPPDHTRLRRLVSRAFTPNTIEGLIPRIETIAQELFKKTLSLTQPIDLVEGFAAALPIVVICELLGVPVEDRPRLVEWSHALARGLDPEFLLPEGIREGQVSARVEFGEYLHDLIILRRAIPGNDLLSALVQVSDEGDVLSEQELIATCILILIAGHETTTSLISTGTVNLLNHPDQIRLLRDEPELIPNAVEELLRFESPVQFTFRHALEDGRIRNQNVTKGSFILLLIGAANRDPEFFQNPELLDVSREPTRHLAFGQGIHFCLGAPLARIEAQIAFRTMLPFLSRFQLAGVPLWKDNAVLRGVKYLPLITT